VSCGQAVAGLRTVLKLAGISLRLDPDPEQLAEPLRVRTNLHRIGNVFSI
jgi:hypothetical protein